MNKIIYVLLDGVGDRPDPKLNFLTPLEAAYTPYLDYLSRKGISALVYPVSEDIAPESDIAVFHMLGYEFKENYPGRGVIEAIGTGLDFQNGNLALRANFATIDENKRLIDRRVGRNLLSEESKQLAASINKDIKFSDPKTSFNFVSTVAHRGVLLIKAEATFLSSNISNSDPAYSREKGIGVAKSKNGILKLERIQPLDESYETKISTDLVNEFTNKSLDILKNHPVNKQRIDQGNLPANAILLRDAGSFLPVIETLPERYGVNFACLLDMPVEKGISRLTAMKEIEAGRIDDYELKAKKAAELLMDYDGTYIHIKGPDEPGHDGDPVRKKRVIEDIDSKFFNVLLNRINLNETIVAISADHSTPCQIKNHSSDPVPLLISGSSVKNDGTCRFTEKNALNGSLGVLKGNQVLPYIIKLAKKK